MVKFYNTFSSKTFWTFLNTSTYSPQLNDSDVKTVKTREEGVFTARPKLELKRKHVDIKGHAQA